MSYSMNVDAIGFMQGLGFMSYMLILLDIALP